MGSLPLPCHLTPSSPYRTSLQALEVVEMCRRCLISSNVHNATNTVTEQQNEFRAPACWTLKSHISVILGSNSKLMELRMSKKQNVITLTRKKDVRKIHLIGELAFNF